MMKDQLIQYVNLLFAGAPDSGEMRQEILQNTLDRYDDLIDQGKSPEAAYRLAISGIGDISEILGRPNETPHAEPLYQEPEKPVDTPTKKLVRAIAIGLYILCPLPLIVLDELADMDILGLCGTLSIVAAATVMMILAAKREDSQEEPRKAPKSPLRKCVDSLIWAIGLALYFVVSMYTSAWFITWVIFPLTGAVQGLVGAIIDLKEAC